MFWLIFSANTCHDHVGPLLLMSCSPLFFYYFYVYGSTLFMTLPFFKKKFLKVYILDIPIFPNFSLDSNY